MTSLKALYFSCAMGLTLVGSAMAVSAAPADRNGKYAVPEAPPLTVEQMFQIPDLQLDVSYRYVPAGVAMQGYSVVRGAWRYSTNYRYTQQDGWHVAGWGAEWVPMSEQNDSANNNLAGAIGGAHTNLILVDDDFPAQNAPGPDDIPSPNGPPVDPTGPTTYPGGACPFMGSQWDGQWTFEWVPTEAITDEDGNIIEVIPGHWRLVYYEFRMSPSDLCAWN